MKKFWQSFKRLARFLLGVFTRRLWLKLLSLALALIIWTYIVSTNTSLTRTKDFDDISVGVGSRAELSDKTLALSTDILEEYRNAIDVTVEVPQSQYTLLKEDNITLSADFSGISSAGKYRVPLRGNTTYGSITRMDPSTILVTVENLDKRENVNLELEIVNADDEAYWYDLDSAGASLNPETITFSGPESLVAKVSRAVVRVDVEGLDRSIRRRGYPVLLLDVNGEIIPSQLLTLSTSNSNVSLNIYPWKTIEVEVDEMALLEKIPEGYELVSYDIQPKTITVAGTSTSTAVKLMLDDVTDVTGTHTYNVIIPSGFKYKSDTEVIMTVNTRPIEDGDIGE